MAVFTQISEDALRAFWAHLLFTAQIERYEAITEGVQNTNYLVHTTDGNKYILTIMEKWVEADDVPFYTAAMQHLAKAGILCPKPMQFRDGASFGWLEDKPAVVTSFLQGRQISEITQDATHQSGAYLAKLHQAGAGFQDELINATGVESWLGRVAYTNAANGSAHGFGIADELLVATHAISAHWPDYLPSGLIHGDYFPDNVFFDAQGQLCGVIDFYFAATDDLAYDLAIALTAWCFDKASNQLQPDLAKALLAGYQSVRPLTSAEREAFALLCQGAAIRFTLSRLEDWARPAQGAYQRKDPMVYWSRFKQLTSQPEHFWLELLA